jgi:ParB/RepB/Spo0J family partition protein
MARTLLRGPQAFRPVTGESARVRRQVGEMPFNKPIVLPTEAIEPNPDNPRKHFDERSLNELASNMQEVGQLHPCIVTLVGEERYQLVAGERRWRAAVRASLPHVWCIVRPNLSTLDRIRMAISENQMREDFTQADRVAALDALDALVDDAGLRASARVLGISPGWLSRQLSLRHDPVLFPALEAGQVSFAQADEIRRAPAHLRQTLVNRAINDGLPSTDIRTIVANARAEERRARSVQREHIAGSDSPVSLRLALDIVLAHPTAGVEEHPVLLQMREAIDRLLGNLLDDPEANTKRDSDLTEVRSENGGGRVVLTTTPLRKRSRPPAT